MKDHFFCTIDGLRNSKTGSELAKFFDELSGIGSAHEAMQCLRATFIMDMKVPINAHEVRFHNLHKADGVSDAALYHKLAKTDLSMVVSGSRLWGINKNDAYLVIVGRQGNNVVIRFPFESNHCVQGDYTLMRVSTGPLLYGMLGDAIIGSAIKATSVLNLISSLEDYARQPSQYLSNQERKQA